MWGNLDLSFLSNARKFLAQFSMQVLLSNTNKQASCLSHDQFHTCTEQSRGDVIDKRT